MENSSVVRESRPTLEPKWRSVTDVQKTWRMYGWVPPSDYRDDYLFKSNREFFQQGVHYE